MSEETGGTPIDAIDFDAAKSEANTRAGANLYTQPGEAGFKKLEEKAINKENAEENAFSKYRPVMDSVVQQLERDAIFNIYGEKTEMQGSVGETNFSVRTPHLRKGKHAFVGIVEIEDGEGKFSAVIRNNRYDLSQFVENSRENPLIRELVPKLYGVTGDWVVMEKLEGLELGELQSRLESDPDFLAKYSESVANFILRTANAGVRIDDVCFVDGHNCMVDPEIGEIKIIEQSNLIAESSLTVNELITRQLFTEIDHIGTNSKDYRAQQVFGVFQRIFQQIDHEQLFVKGRVIKPTHPDYRDAYFFERWEKLPEEKYQEILANPNLREGMTVAFFESGMTQAFSQDLIDSIKNNDIETFRRLGEQRSFKTQLTDRNDPRSHPVVVES